MGEHYSWAFVADHILLEIFQLLKRDELGNVAQVCNLWNRIACHELLWKHRLCHDFKIPVKSMALKEGRTSYKQEYCRIYDQTPLIESGILNGQGSHTDQVLHVSFAHNGRYFSTCAKDGFVKVWIAGDQIELYGEVDMKIGYKWKYTQFSQWNESDTLLLVSGVHPGSNVTSGEIAVFSLEAHGMELQSRVVNKPYDVFGTWYSDTYLISGDLKLLGNFASSSVLWLNSAYQETESEQKAILKQLYRLYNQNASSVRLLMVANCQDSLPCDGAQSLDGLSMGDSNLRGLKNELQDSCSSSLINDEENVMPEYGDEVVLDIRTKWLIFTGGSETYTPHLIGLKRMSPVRFQSRISTCNLADRIAERRHAQESRLLDAQLAGEVPLDYQVDWNIRENVAHLFDGVDHIIDMRGHIIGMTLSPDHKFLYVNVRSWPEGAVVPHPMSPPPISQQVDIRIVDLTNCSVVNCISNAHKAYTPNDECFFIFLDVADDYIASGAEEKNGYVWDRHFGVRLATLPHTDVVNCVAFNPTDPEMLVSVSDDHQIKVWRSRGYHRQHRS